MVNNLERLLSKLTTLLEGKIKTIQKVIYSDSRNMKEMADESVDLVVTSPPYPMIEMWDKIFTEQNGKIGNALEKNDGPAAFELMHKELDKVWDELFRVLKKGSIACINMGDATRTIAGRFALYTNHSRILTYMQKIGFSALPAILWRKQTNAPNKFMGSGMMPPGAYVTLEHEYILILRKGNKREFKTNNEKDVRRESSFFWEERNNWFSDVWMDLKGAQQSLLDADTRKRSAAFPFELPYRLISMFSVKGDTVLDPFSGVGTTMYAAMATGRYSVNYEIDQSLNDCVISRLSDIVDFSNKRIVERLENHLEFTKERFKKKGKFKHRNKHYLFPVITGQETNLLINELKSVKQNNDNTFEVIYSDEPQNEFVGSWDGYVMSETDKKEQKKAAAQKKRLKQNRQKKLFN
jgi:DNA modification methylase